MQNPKKTRKNHAVAQRKRFLLAGVLMSALLTAGVVTAIAKHESRAHTTLKPAQVIQAKQGLADNQPVKNSGGAEIAGKKLPLNVQTLQQGPLTQDQAQQLADALKENQSMDGLVQVQHPDGSISMDLQGRFQNVMLAKKLDDGSVEQACVDNSKAAAAFLQSTSSSTETDLRTGRKAVVKE